MITDEALMVMRVQQLAEKYKVKAKFDFDTNTINFDGEIGNEIELARELVDFFERRDDYVDSV